MSGTEDLPLAAAAYQDQNGVRAAKDLFAREGRLAGILWNSFWKEFDTINHDDATYGAALKIFIARYEVWLKEGQ
jgi:hypothetical protein